RKPARDRDPAAPADRRLAALSAARLRPLVDPRRRPPSGAEPAGRAGGAAAMSAPIWLLAPIGFGVFAARRLLTYLHLFQQEEYDNARFLAWLAGNRAFDRRLSLVLIALGAAQFFVMALPAAGFAGLAGAACLVVASIERDPRRTAKKPLAMTARAMRIFVIGFAVLVPVGIAAALPIGWVWVWVV